MDGQDYFPALDCRQVLNGGIFFICHYLNVDISAAQPVQICVNNNDDTKWSKPFRNLVFISLRKIRKIND